MHGAAQVRVPKLVRMHSNEMQEVTEASAGDIVAMFGVDCASGTTFTDGKVNYSLTSMHVPDPVVSLALIPKDRNQTGFGKALGRFTKEDPTFRVHTDDESNQAHLHTWPLASDHHTPTTHPPHTLALLRTHPFAWLRPLRRSSRAWASCTSRSTSSA